MFFSRLIRKLRERRPDLFMRKKKPMGGSIPIPGLFGGLGSFNLDKIRKLKAQRMGLPDPADFDSNELPFPQPGASSDIMPKDGLLPKQPPELGTAPNMQRGNAALLPPDFMMLPKPFMGMNMGMPNFLSSGQMPKTVVGMSKGGGVSVGDLAVSAARGAYKAKTAPLQLASRVSNLIAPNTKLSRGLSKLATPFAEGGEAKKDPNPGITALRKVAPDVVKRMGYQAGGMVNEAGDFIPATRTQEEIDMMLGRENAVKARALADMMMPSGSDADMMNYQNTLMALRELKDSLPENQLPFFESALREILGESGRTISNQDKDIMKKIGFDGEESDFGMRKLAAVIPGVAPIARGLTRLPETMLTPRDQLLMELLPPGPNVIRENSRLGIGSLMSD